MDDQRTATLADELRRSLEEEREMLMESLRHLSRGIKHVSRRLQGDRFTFRIVMMPQWEDEQPVTFIGTGRLDALMKEAKEEYRRVNGASTVGQKYSVELIVGSADNPRAKVPVSRKVWQRFL